MKRQNEEKRTQARTIYSYFDDTGNIQGARDTLLSKIFYPLSRIHLLHKNEKQKNRRLLMASLFWTIFLRSEGNLNTRKKEQRGRRIFFGGKKKQKREHIFLGA